MFPVVLSAAERRLCQVSLVLCVCVLLTFCMVPL